jgi:S1-C subfamily serine protease
VLLAGVRAGGGAEAAGMRRGDVLVKLGTFDISSVEDLMFALNASKPGQTVTAVVLRDGKSLELKATFQESKRR